MDKDARDRCKMHDCIEGGYAVARLQLIEIRVGRHHVEHLAGIGDVSGEIVDARMVEWSQIDIDDPVALVQQIRHDMLSCLAGAAGKQDAFLSCHRSLPCLRFPSIQ